MVDTSPGYVVVGPKKIEDPRNLGRVSLTTVLSRSSNVGATKIAMSLEPDQLWNVMAKFGLGSLTSSGFPGESAGLLTHYNDWRKISQATLAYGYGVSVTPLQLAQAYAAIGDAGNLRPVSLVKLDSPNDGQQIIGEDTATAICHMMEEVVRPGGSGSAAGVAGYRIAGKTGTSWKFAAGGYSEDKYFSIFAGLAPASDPRLAAVIVINEPTGDQYYGGEVAAPVFSEVMTESLRLLAIAPDALPTAPAGSLVQAMSQ
jgi:cell division protein FtsI (penicillin-binding protein 3)